MSTSLRNDSCLLKLCSLSCTLVRSTQPLPAQFFGLAKPLRRNSEISHGCTLRHTDSRLVVSNTVEIDERWVSKLAVLYWWQKKTRFGANPWGDFPNQKIMQVNTVVPHLYSRVHVNPFRFGGVISEKPSHDPQSGCNIGSSGLYYIISIISLSSTNAMILQQTANN